jgi:FdhE protein
VDFWQKQIKRAGELAEASNELLIFYTHLLRAQREVSELLKTTSLSGELERDLPLFRSALKAILNVVEDSGPPPLVEQARILRTASAQGIDETLLSYWHAPSDTEFFAKSFLQPYGQIQEACVQSTIDEKSCPFCGGKPQLSFLQNKEATAESGNRDLLCAKCLSTWPFRRVVCANCGEEDPARLGYFQTPAIDHVRIEACDTCRHYLKGVDLTRLGIAQPLVDEVAAAPLDLWATERGYKKIELNLVGL